jgi:adenylate kinase family enzyme
MKVTICGKCGYGYDRITCPCGWLSADVGPSLDAYKYATIDDFPERLITECLSKLRDGSLLLTGPSGVGKTHLSIALVKNSGRGFKLVTKPPKLPSEYSEWYIEAINAGILIVDELCSDHFDIVNARMNSNKKTIGCTNVDLNSSEKIIDDRLINRFLLYKITGTSRWGSSWIIDQRTDKIRRYRLWERFMYDKSQTEPDSFYSKLKKMDLKEKSKVLCDMNASRRRDQ